MSEDLKPTQYAQHILEGLAHLDQGITIFDQNLKLVVWNRKFLEVYGYPPSLAYQGADFASFIEFNARAGDYGPGDAQAQVAERVDTARRFEKHRFERVRADGRVIEVVGTPLPNGGFVATYTDITEKVRQQEVLETLVRTRTQELRLSEERLSLIADEVPAGIAHVDKDMNILYANKRFARAYKKTPADVIGLNTSDVLYAKTLEESARFFEQARRGALVDFEMRLELPGGRFKDVRTLLRPGKPASGEVADFYLVSIDVTRRKSTMSALMRSQKMDALGRMASGISHDFNNLLTIILGNIVPLSEQLTDADLVEEFLIPAISAARRGSSLTKRLLTLARREQVDPVPTQIGEAISEIGALVQSSIPSSLKVELRQQDDLPMAMVDRSQLEMAILNLALNARDATQGTGKITIDTSAPDLSQEEAELFRITAGRYVRIRFSDDGCGMAPSLVEKIFEPFFTSKAAGSGSGLGLSMVYGFVQQSNGAICVDSAPGKGTTFTILLPEVCPMDLAAVDARPAPKTAAPPQQYQDGSTGQIVLLVEDDADVRRTIRRKIAGLGFPIVEAGDADEAMMLLEQLRDVGYVVSDVDMPGPRNGFDLARTVRRLTPEIRMVLMSGQNVQTPADLSSVPFLRKPFSEAELSQHLRVGEPQT
ncbi:hybrid sensor histidine kinase/response regulator [Thalassobius vesicularis]|uniref:hybrid sensor histidine kinase/response regulator n=1 Tax=Thalassobius vesicularis TaxID=1294297 RepID=UPI001454B94B|nr:PAS-domain containing protein [Thalassobius vesicularis]